MLQHYWCRMEGGIYMFTILGVNTLLTILNVPIHFNADLTVGGKKKHKKD